MKTKNNNLSSKILFLLCFVAYTFSYLGRYNFSSCRHSMIQSGLIDNDFSGIIVSAYLICYGAGQFINGRLGVKISPKYMVGTGLLGSGLMNILMGINSTSPLFVILWALNGFFCSMLWSPIIRIFTEWMEQAPRIRAGANISLTIPIGMTLSYLLSSLILSIGNWRAIFIVSGLCVSFAGLVWFLGLGAIKKQISETAKRVAEAAKVSSSLTTSGNEPKKKLTLSIFFGTGLALIAVVALFNGSLKDCVIDWIQKYLIDTYNVTDSTAALVSTLLPLFTVGGPYIAIFLDRQFFKNEVKTCFVLFLGTAASLACVLIPNLSSPLFSIIMLGLAMSFMWGVNTMILTYVPYRYGALGISSAVSGTLNCMAYIAASGCEVLYGKVSGGFGWNATVGIWVAFAALGTFFCLIVSSRWKKLQPNDS